jgi:hypothetical protein
VTKIETVQVIFKNLFFHLLEFKGIIFLLPTNYNRHFLLLVENAGDRKGLLLVKVHIHEVQAQSNSKDQSLIFLYAQGAMTRKDIYLL